MSAPSVTKIYLWAVVIAFFIGLYFMYGTTMVSSNNSVVFVLGLAWSVSLPLAVFWIIKLAFFRKPKPEEKEKSE